MDWQGKESADGRVEDRRGIAPGVAMGGGVVSLLIMAAAYFLGVDPNQAKQLANAVGGGRIQQKQGDAKPINDENLKFSEQVIAMTDKVWEVILPAKWDRDYEQPKMVLFAQAVDTGCGRAPSAVGPFYCPADSTVYLDPTFFNELEQKLGGSKAKFSQAYVIAHEVGHHVQNLLGYNALVDKYKAREGENSGIRLELQADYLAGVWAHHADKKYRIVEQGDVEEAIKTAKNIGDDAIQKKTQGWTSPEKYNHGKADQRYKYFMLGLKTGDASKPALDKFFDPSVKPLDL
ncbi:neutral zinc metallopeptidase [soil metagenome]